MSIAFKGCEMAAAKCTSTGAAEGEIVTNTFEGKLGNLKSSSTPGIALTQPKAKTNDSEFTCGTTKVTLSGGVVGTVAPTGKIVAKLTISYIQKTGIQLFESTFGGPLDILSTTIGTGSARQTGLALKDTITLPELIEIT